MSNAGKSDPIRTAPGAWSENDVRRMPAQGFQKHLGIVLDRIDPRTVRAHVDVECHHINSGGSVHGGVLMSLADSVGAMAAVQNLGPNQRTVTLESKTSFVRPCTGTKIFAESTPLHIGQKTSVWHIVVTDDQGRTCAHVCQTQLHFEA